MESGHRKFIAGTILGTTLGLLLGHFALWRNNPPRQIPYPVSAVRHVEAASEPVLNDETDLTTAFAVMPNLPADVMSEIPLTDQVSSVPQLLPLTEAESTSAKPGKGKELAEPAPLRIPEASPLQAADQPTDTHTAIRELIDREMLDSTPQEREVWFDSLKDLSLPHAVGVLEMWKLTGSSGSPGGEFPDWSSPPGSDGIPSPFFQEPADVPAVSPVEMTAHENLQFAETPGYKRRIIITHQDLAGSIVTNKAIDFRPGRLEVSYLPLDWAIEGPSFFVVSNGDTTYYTRHGHLTLDANRYLALQIGDDYYRLQPEVCLPEDAFQVILNETGGIQVKSGENQDTITLTLATFVNPAGLEPAGSVLFRATIASGKPHIRAASECSQVHQFMLEMSNVIPAE